MTRSKCVFLYQESLTLRNGVLSRTENSCYMYIICCAEKNVNVLIFNPFSCVRSTPIIK